jgi:8-oxo-dGTP diphosphatase
MSAARPARGRASGPAFPCAVCGRPIRRTAGERPRRIACPRCRFLIYDYPRSCAGMIVLKGDSVLVLRRGHAPRKGWLDVPGGFMDAGETVERCARRELREETGLAVGKVELVGRYWDLYHLRGFGRIPTLNTYFLGRWRSGVPHAGDDAAFAEWVPLAQLGRKEARFAWQHMTALLRDVKRLAGR